MTALLQTASDSPTETPETEPKNASPRFTELVKSYCSFGKKNVEGILGLAGVIEQAEQELGKRELYEFYEAVKLEYNGATDKKLRKIAEQRARFTPVLHRLPNTWTTLYALASLKPVDFEKLVRDDVLHPFITMKEIRAYLYPPVAQKEPAPRVALDLSKVSKGRAGDFAKRLKALCAEFNLELGETHRATLEAFLVPNGTGDRAKP